MYVFDGIQGDKEVRTGTVKDFYNDDHYTYHHIIPNHQKNHEHIPLNYYRSFFHLILKVYYKHYKVFSYINPLQYLVYFYFDKHTMYYFQLKIHVPKIEAILQFLLFVKPLFQHFHIK